MSRTRSQKAVRPRHAAFHRTRADHQTELREDYVELIAELLDERGEARGTDIAERLGVSNATVVKALRKLQDDKLIRQEPYRAVFLTEAGQRLADEGRRRHAIVERFLVALGVPAETARIDSEGLEHHVSAETLAAMERFLSDRGEER
jgi:DtxR family transcriptional regulator, manganese transport regulator